MTLRDKAICLANLIQRDKDVNATNGVGLLARQFLATIDDLERLKADLQFTASRDEVRFERLRQQDELIGLVRELLIDGLEKPEVRLLAAKCRAALNAIEGFSGKKE
ncbi:MAG: hypothetical protein KGL39_47135 [Patescibacteria group bacterium]|nr:hypothetical protein [Patescibacteria group bacterium]